MTEIRTTSSTGGQKGVKPERFSLMPRKGLAWISRVFGFGAEKYDAHNWRRGYEWSKSFDALERHFQAAKDGETYDEESGLPHLAHAGFHILVLLTWLEEQGEGADNPFDDRWPAAMERARRVAEAEEALKAAESGGFPLRFIAGVDGATLSFEATDVDRTVLTTIFGAKAETILFDESTQDVEGIPTRPFDRSYEDWAAEQTVSQGVQRAFDLRD